MSLTFLQLEEQRQLVVDSERLSDEIRVQSVKAMGVIDRSLEILHDDQRRRYR
jgi:hypothetical protein